MPQFNLSAGERSNNENMRWKEVVANPDRYLENREAVTSRATHDIAPEFETPVIRQARRDADGNVLQPGTLQTIRETVGPRFDAAVNPYNLEFDRRTMHDITNLDAQYVRTAGYDADAVAALQHAAGHVTDVMLNNGLNPQGRLFLTGEQYQRMRSSLNKLAMNSEGQRADALHDFVDVLDRGFDRSVGRTNPAAVGQIQEARRQWKAFLTVEKAAGGANANHITPAALEAAAKSTYGKRAHLQGFDPFWWAPSANAVIRTMAQSGTAPRSHALEFADRLAGAGGAIIGSLIGQHTGMPEGGVHGLLIGREGVAPLIAPPLRAAMAAVSRNPVSQAYWGNQFLTGRQRVGLPGILNAVREGAAQ